MKSKVMGVDAANRRKNAKLKVTASGGTNPGANLKPLSKPAPMGGAASGVSRGVSGTGAGGGGKMPRPKPRPDSKMAPKSSMRPRTRSDKKAEDDADAAADRAMKHSQPPKLVYRAMGGKVSKMATGGKLKMVEKDGKKVPAFAADGVGKMAMGGMCRGMGAAKKGGKYKE